MSLSVSWLVIFSCGKDEMTAYRRDKLSVWRVTSGIYLSSAEWNPNRTQDAVYTVHHDGDRCIIGRR